MLERKGIIINRSSEARREKIDGAAAWELFRAAERVSVCRGKKVLDFIPDEANREEILQLALGRSQTLRAPTLKINNTFIVGFSEERYETL